MGDDHKLEGIFYSINGSTGEMKPIGKPIGNPIEIPKFTSGGIIDEKILDLGETGEIVVPINPKIITKKRFIKLIMSKGYQRNEAYKMHGEYMKKYKSRSLLEMIFFEMFYNIKPNKFKLKIGDKEIEGEIII